MENTHKFPKQLTMSSETSCCLNDETETTALFTAYAYDNNTPFKNEVIKRYNNYPWMYSTMIVLACSTVILLTALILK
jgi:hypothetical protein